MKTTKSLNSRFAFINKALLKFSALSVALFLTISISVPTYTEALSYVGAPITLSQSSVSISTGQTVQVGIFGGSGNYYVSMNSNSNVVSASTGGNTLQVQGISAGSANIIVCSLSSTSPCATLQVFVSGNSWNNNVGLIDLSQTSLFMIPGQTQSIRIYSTLGSYYLASGSSGNIATAYISGSDLIINAIGQGTTNFTVCLNNNTSACRSVFVQVGFNNTDNWNSSWNSTWNNWLYPNNIFYQSSQYYPNINTQPLVNYVYNYSQPSQVYGQPVSGVFLSQIPATGADGEVDMLAYILSIMISCMALTVVYIKFYSTENKVSDKAKDFKLRQQQIKLSKVKN